MAHRLNLRRSKAMRILMSLSVVLYLQASGGICTGSSCWGGEGGTISVRGASGALTADGGAGNTDASSHGGNGGNISVESGGTALDISAVGGDGYSPGGNGGTVHVHAMASAGQVLVKGGYGSLYTGGTGGHAYIDGTSGDIFAQGGDSYNYIGGDGGTVILNGTSGAIWVDGGTITAGGDAGAGGNITLNIGSLATTLSANGGSGIDDGNGTMSSGGNGGTITIHAPSTHTGTPTVSGGTAFNGGTPGTTGTIN